MGISLQDAQSVFTDTGLRTQYGVILPPGARVAAYVRSTGFQSGDDSFLSSNLVATLAAGLARVRAGLGDFVVCLPGHAETWVAADTTAVSAALSSGAKIIGIGTGLNQPSFTFNATAASLAVSVPNVSIIGCLFLLDGINAVVNAFNITGADFQFLYNELETSTTAKAATTVMTLGTGAQRANIVGNIFRGLASVPSTNGILVSGAINDARICDNEMVFATTTTNGNINITGVAVGLKILRNVINNTVAASITAINYANVAITGQARDNTLTVLSTGAVSAGVTGINVGGTNNLTGYFNNFTVNDPNKSGLLTPAVDT